ncbi:hypothetical protein PR202_gb23731 [Eleusine coracana subsp. coracana]|uniref:Uncharacterized protein n=1 Tax=Eleusine coracana subsp. coracana TaxID=191504 RepID=A0AAV5FH10_ELECO|nr:hypothetical protein PR202_gb23731 [Eleusine coracana subsp. coracana]
MSLLISMSRNGSFGQWTKYIKVSLGRGMIMLMEVLGYDRAWERVQRPLEYAGLGILNLEYMSWVL